MGLAGPSPPGVQRVQTGSHLPCERIHEHTAKCDAGEVCRGGDARACSVARALQRYSSVARALLRYRNVARAL